MNSIDAQGDDRKRKSWRKTQRSIVRTYENEDGTIEEEKKKPLEARQVKGIKIRELPCKDGSISYQCDIPASIVGKRLLKRFKTFDEAQAYVSQAVIRRENKGLESFSLQSSELSDAVEALRILKGSGTLKEAAGFFVKHNYPRSGDIRLINLQAKYEKNLVSLKSRPKTLQEKKYRLNPFVQFFGADTLIKEISGDGLREYFKSNPHWSLHIKRSHYAVISAFLGYAVEEGYLESNPISEVKRPAKLPETKPGILTLDQTQKLLEAILKADSTNQKAIGSYVALGLFCGIRTEELNRLTWDKINIEQKTVEISEGIAKKRRYRYVEIPDNAVQWLKAFGIEREGDIRVKNHRKLFELSRSQAGINSWPSNAMRHSFASYHFELHGNSQKTTIELGHKTDDLLFSHYRSLTKKGSGSQYFAISPTNQPNIIPMPATAS